MVPIDIAPLAGTGVLEMSLPITLAAIDHMLGGPGGTQQNRGLTDIETSLLDGLLDQILGVLRYSFESLDRDPADRRPDRIQPALPAGGQRGRRGRGRRVRHGRRPRAEPAHAVPAARLAAARADRAASARGRTARASSRSVEQAARRVRQRLGDVSVEVSVRFRPVGLSPTRLMSLAVGDVLVLDHRFGAPADRRDRRHRLRAGRRRQVRHPPGRARRRFAPSATPRRIE